MPTESGKGGISLQAQSAKAEEALRLARRKAFGKRLLDGTCSAYTLLNLLYFLAYLTIVLPGLEDGRFGTMIRGGISVKGHLWMLLLSFCVFFVLGLILRKKEPKKRNGFCSYLVQSCIWYTVLEAALILVYAFYLDTLYNPYAVTEAALLKGPSFLLSAGSLGVALFLPLLNRIYRFRIPSFFKMLLHLISVLALLCVFYLGLADGFSSPAAYLVFAAVFSLFYAVSYLIWYLLRGAQKKDENDEEEYESLYMTDEMRRQREAEKQNAPK